MDAARQHRIEMRHELDVVAVVAADVFQAVGEVLAAGEMLFESRKAAAERVAPRIDDLRVRQQQLDQADVREVVRHLVDEEGRVGLALDARLLQILLAQGAAVRARSGRASASRVARLAAAVAAGRQ